MSIHHTPCLEAKNSFNAEHKNVLELDYKETVVRGGGWSNGTMTNQAIAQLSQACSDEGGRFTAVTEAILDCKSSKTLTPMNGYHNIGDCFPNIDVCADYTFGSFVADTMSCVLVSETTLVDIPELKRSSVSTTSPSPTLTNAPSKFHSDDIRMKCQYESHDFFEDKSSYDTASLSYSQAGITALNTEWSNFTYPLSETQELEQACNQIGGKFISFTGLLNCRGFGDFTTGRNQAKYYENAANCFPPGGACDHYTTSAVSWWIDFNWFWKYDCSLVDDSNQDGHKNSNDDNADIITPTPTTSPISLASPPEIPKTMIDADTSVGSTVEINAGIFLLIFTTVIVVAVLATLHVLNGRRRQRRDAAFSLIRDNFEMSDLSLEEEGEVLPQFT